jgi:hypothetical protein
MPTNQLLATRMEPERALRAPSSAHYRSNMCIPGPKVCSGQHQIVCWHLKTHLIRAKGQSGKKETGSTFAHNKAIRTHCWFSVLSCTPESPQAKERTSQVKNNYWGRRLAQGKELGIGRWPNTQELRAGQIQGEGSLVSGVQKNLNPSTWCIWDTNNCWKWIRNEKVTAPQSKGGQEFKKYKPHWTIFVCCSVAIRVQKWLVKLLLALL